MEHIERKERLEDKLEFYSMAENDVINQKIEELDEQVSQMNSARSGRSVQFSTFGK